MPETNTGNSGSVPEFLINQKTLTCLAVIKGTNANDAVIGMQKCTGRVEQQWFPSNGQWQWGGNRELCLAPKGKGDVHLVPCDTAKESWKFDEGDRLVIGAVSLGVRVAKPSKPVKLWPKPGGPNKKWWTFTSMRESLEDAPLAEHSFPPQVMNICKKEMKWDPSKSNKGKHSKKKQKEEKKCLEKGKECETSTSDGQATAESPEYLISQSSFKCLTVIKGSTPKDAVIGVAAYNGSAKQQWFITNGQWQWGGDRNVCLEPDLVNKKLGLAEISLSSISWNYEKSGLMAIESHALEEVEVEGKASRVNLNPQHGLLSQKWWTLSSLKPFVGKNFYPFSPQDKNIYKQELVRGLMNKMSPLSEPLPYPRNVARFPGRVLPKTPRINRIISLDLKNLGQRDGLRMRAPPKDWQATSLYVAAGDLFSIILPETTTPQQASQIKIRVGAQTDTLNPETGKISKGNKKFRRMPVVSEIFDTTPGVNILRSQYGGNLIFVLKGGEKFELIAEVQNVVEAPHYIINKTGDEEWEKMKELEVPYSILESERVVLVVPTFAATKIPNPEILLQRYDNVVSIIEDLAGFDKNDPGPRGKHWLVDDIQISAGSAHAGFPIMFERRFNNIASQSTPHSWVVWHEMGHNYQQPRFWCNAYGSESTVNLFSLYCQEKIRGTHRLKKNDTFLKASEEVDQGVTFENAKGGIKLVFMMEIQNAYPEKGWDMFRHLNQTTRALSEEEVTKVVSSRQHQFDYVYKVLSQYIGVDLIPHYQRWGLKISEEAQNHINQLGLPQSPSDLSVRTKFN